MVVVDRRELIRRAARRIGARTGSISSGTGSTAVLSGLINTTGDDGLFRNGLLFMLDATSETDKEKLVELWEDISGTAHFADRTDETYANETYILDKYGGYTLTEYRDALNVAMRETRRTYRSVIALAQNQRLVPLTDLSWVIGGDDIDAVWVSDSPNLLHNEDFGLWDNGDSLAPDGWTLAGTDATVAREAGIRSSYGATLSRTGADATLYQSIPPQFREYVLRSANANLTTFLGRAWVVCSTASIARIGIYNGSSTTYGSYHTGGGYPELLTVSYTPTATDTDARLVLSVDTTNGSATFHWAGLVHNSDLPDALKDQGSSAYSEREVKYHVRNIGGVPHVELMSAPGGQLIVYSRRPFPAMDSDADEVDEQYARALEAGLLSKLLEVRKANQDRTRLDVILAEERSTWNRLNKNFIDLPVPTPHWRAEVRGA